jgi:hypothetical protein
MNYTEIAFVQNGSFNTTNIDPIITKCFSKFLFESHTIPVVNFSEFNFIGAKQNLSLTEISIKLTLCIISIICALSGNIMVFYTIIIKPRLKTNAKLLNKELALRKGEVYKIDDYDINQNVLRKSLSQDNKRNSYHFYPEHKDLNYLNLDKRIFVTTHVYKPYKNKPVNLLILNLCICDLMIVLWCSWVHMVNSLSENWIMGAFFCRFNTFVQVMSLIAAISTLSVISYERFKGIVFTMKRKLNHRDCARMLFFIWLFSILAALPIFLYRKQYKRIWRDRIEIW